MVPVNRKEVSLYEEAKAGLSSLIQQTATVFVGLVVMLLITGGAPSSFVVALSFCLGTTFVAWSEQRRIKKLRATIQTITPEISSNNVQQESTSKETSVTKDSKFTEDIESAINNISGTISDQPKARIITVAGGNYIEFNSESYVQGNYINMSYDLTQAAAQIQGLLEQLQKMGVNVNVAQEQVAKDMATQAQSNPTMKDKLVKWGQSLGDATASDVVKEIVKLAIRSAGIPLP